MLTMARVIAEGHDDASDFLFLCAFALAVCAAVLFVSESPRSLPRVALGAAVALIAMAFFVL